MSVYTERAAELFGKGFNCSQAVFAAFCDKFGMDEKTALKVASEMCIRDRSPNVKKGQEKSLPIFAQSFAKRCLTRQVKKLTLSLIHI